MHADALSESACSLGERDPAGEFREPLEEALQHATSEMFALLQNDYHLDATSASVLMGMCVAYEIGNVFDPAYTVVCKLAKRDLME